FIKIKPTILYGLLAAVLIGGQLAGRSLLRPVLGTAIQLRDAGWRALTWRWGLFFVFMGVLNEVLRHEPSRPEAHFVLAILEGRRGHLDRAETHLTRFLGAAGDRFPTWRASAERRLAQLEDERRLMRSALAGELRLVDLAHPDFRIQADQALLETGSGDFARTVARYLDDVRGFVGAKLASVPSEPMGVVLYGKASYLKTHGHRFSFQTVGFFDGRIHVVSAAHPKGELRSLLIHEYTHALFREQTGGDRPYWLNEGLAEWIERASQARPPLSREERSSLRVAIEEGHWLSLRRLAPSFAGLGNGEARLAYTVSTAAADWLLRHTDAAGRSQLLALLGEGRTDDEALVRVLGIGTMDIDAALRNEILGQFAAPPAPASGPAS
ncbi:MAG: septation protein IspZ, partial [Myxococcota bacterium]